MSRFGLALVALGVLRSQLLGQMQAMVKLQLFQVVEFQRETLLAVAAVHRTPQLVLVALAAAVTAVLDLQVLELQGKETQAAWALQAIQHIGSAVAAVVQAEWEQHHWPRKQGRVE
jgi:hypothetical protein